VPNSAEPGGVIISVAESPVPAPAIIRPSSAASSARWPKARWLRSTIALAPAGNRRLGNTIAGAIGGGAGGQALQALIPALALAAGNIDIGSLISQVGAILTAIVGVVKNRTAGSRLA
jgi:hypothetical protein